MLGGGALGYGAGSLLSHLISPDEYIEDEDGKKYRQRNIMRWLLPLLGTYGGAMAGSHFAKDGVPGGQYVTDTVNSLLGNSKG